MLINCIFINLRSARERREFLEQNFIDAGFSAEFRLERLEAISTDTVKGRKTQGRIREAEKACFLSHLEALELSIARAGHALIVEDDALFCAQSETVIRTAIEAMPHDSWDLLFTDVCIPDPIHLFKLFAARRAQAKTGRVRFINLAETVFAGSTAYVVNADRKKHVLETLAAPPSLDTPYDLFLRDTIHKGALKAFVVFPFATSLSPFADASVIQQTTEAERLHNLCWNSIRRLMWIGADPAIVSRTLDQVRPDFIDSQTAAFAKILGIMFSESFGMI